MVQKKEYTGTWIPAYIMECQGLSYSEKFLYAEVASYRTCFASNAHLAERMVTSERQIQRWLANLEKHGFILKTGFDGRQRLLVANGNAELETRQNVRGRGDKNDVADTTKSTPVDNSIENNRDNSLITIGEPLHHTDPETQDVLDHWVYVFGRERTWTLGDIKAAKKLIKEFGTDKVKGAIEVAKLGRNQQYCPVITNFRELESKWEKLEAWAVRTQTAQANRSVEITE